MRETSASKPVYEGSVTRFTARCAQLSSPLSRFHFPFLMFVCWSTIQPFILDLFYPLDVNECDENPNYCQYGGQCVNTPGSYRCLCQQGYEAGNGGTYCIGKGVLSVNSI